MLAPKSEHMCKERNEVLVWGSQTQSQGFPIGTNKFFDASPFLILVIEMLLLQEFIVAVGFFTCMACLNNIAVLEFFCNILGGH